MTITAKISNSNGGGGKICYMAFAVSGTTTIAAVDAQSVTSSSGNSNDAYQLSATYLVTGLTAGNNNIFTAKYKAGANTCNFANRNIIVTPY